MQRRQLFAVVLMTMMFVAWSVFLPKPPPPLPAQQQTQTPASPLGAPVEQASEPVPESEAGLPPVAESLSPEEDEIGLSDGDLELTFTKVGARLKRARVILGKEGELSRDLVPETHLPDVEAQYPFGLRFPEEAGQWGEALDRRRWEVERDPAARALNFSIEIPNQARITKRFELTDRAHVVRATVSVTNLAAAPKVLGVDTKEAAFALTWGPNVASGDLDKGVTQEIVWHSKAGVEHLYTTDLAWPEGGTLYTQRSMDTDWLAIKSAYFVVALRPDFAPADTWALGTHDNFKIGAGAPRMELAPNATEARAFEVYVGPTHLESLQAAWPGLDSVLQFFTSFGLLDWFAKFLLGILNWFHDHVIANYGLAIIFLTLIVRIALLPLTWKSMKSMKKMQKLGPEMERIKQEIGEDNPQELQKRMWALYQERGVNPLGGCFPLLLQMPIFIALYRMLWSAFELRGAHFVGYIDDLSQPDRLYSLPFEIPFPFMPIDALNLLPLLMGVSMFVSTKLMPTSGPVQNQQQKIIMWMMPIMITIFCYNLAAGLSLYILTSTVLGIAQNYLIQVKDEDLVAKPKPKTARKPTHPYEALQARKREAAKEARRDKRAKTSKNDREEPAKRPAKKR